MIYKKFVKQIYLNTLISNKFRYNDYFNFDWDNKSCIHCAIPMSTVLLAIYTSHGLMSEL